MPLQRLVRLSVLLATAVVLYRFSFHIPLFPAFLKYDASEVPALVAALAYGPWTGLLIELLKNVMHAFLKGGANPIGLAANFVAGALLIMGTSLIHGAVKARRWKWLAVAGGAALLAVGMIPFNLYFFLPAHGMKASTITATAVNVLTPFNFVKGLISARIGLLFYERLSFLLTQKEALYSEQG